MYIVDRIEDRIAILECCETETELEVKKSVLPKGVREGDVLNLVDGIYSIDREATEKMRNDIRARLDRLFHNEHIK